MHDDILQAVVDSSVDDSSVDMFSYVVPHDCVMDCAHSLQEAMRSCQALSACDVSILQQGGGTECGGEVRSGVRMFCTAPSLLVSSLTSLHDNPCSILLVALERESDHKTCNALVREQKQQKQPRKHGKRIVVFLGRKCMKAVRPDRLFTHCDSGRANQSLVSWVQRFVADATTCGPVDSVLDLVELVCVTHHSISGALTTTSSAKSYLDNLADIVHLLCRCEHSEDDRDEEEAGRFLSIHNVQMACRAFHERHMMFSGNRKPRVVRLDLLSFKTTL